jgi:hypothetical protein
VPDVSRAALYPIRWWLHVPLLLWLRVSYAVGAAGGEPMIFTEGDKRLLRVLRIDPGPDEALDAERIAHAEAAAEAALVKQQRDLLAVILVGALALAFLGWVR